MKRGVTYGGVNLLGKVISSSLIFLFCLSLIGCNDNQDVENSNDDYTVYLVNKDMTGLEPKIIDIKGNDKEEKVQYIIDYLRTGDDSNDFQSALPEEVELRSVEIGEGNVILNLSREYEVLDTEPTDVLLFRASIVKSIIGISGVNTVEFQVEGLPLKSASGAIIGPMSDKDIILDNSVHSEAKKVNLTLYFSDKEAMYLVPTVVEVELNPDEQIERTVLNLLIAGPEDDDLVSTIPKETKIKDIYTNEGVCIIDLNEEFVTEHVGGSTGETHTIYSIVNSLTELPNISKVKFMIDGETRETYKGHMQFNLLFEKNYEIIKKVDNN